MIPLDVGAAMGKIGLPAPLSELGARDWDAIVVGGGHNGLTAAAYLARAGRSVLVGVRRASVVAVPARLWRRSAARAAPGNAP